MSDTALNKVIQYGTTAARVAFVPNPALTSQVLYIWYDTDNPPNLYIWNGAAWVQINAAGGGNVVGPAGATDLAIARYDGITGQLIKDSLILISNLGALTLPDNIRQVFNPGVTVAGINVGALAGDPSTPINGDVWYDSTANELTARINGVNVALGAGGGGGITQLTGDVTAGPGAGSVVATIAANAVTTAKVINDAITYAKIQDVSATDRLLGRDTAAAGDIEEIPVSSGLEFTGGPGLRVTQAVRTRQIGITIDGGGSVLTTGLKGFKSFPVAGTITGVRLLADVAGAIVIDIWKDTYANFPPSVTESITAAAKPTIPATNQKAEDTTLTGWTVAVAAGDVFGFNIDSVATITRITLELTIVVT